ncbi:MULTISPECIES: GGDEF domain-containing protein [Arthrospira]|uniref:GGDEF domain-containing protein n=2 Tax=Oscillatoriophycideae TaxID=1301283 RepID=UPI000B0B541E|nr:GGDEF domain-containing protein [Arthrospira platensis]MDT9312403.1 diguanylate cyclase [Limnospira sp. Paracas R14]QQW32138.2 diguanylate cyclase [Arthrospira sp. PCC 9108]
MMDHLHIESTLQDLRLYDIRTDINQPGNVLAKIFENDGSLPGVILYNFDDFVGIISQRQFWRTLSRPYGRELFLTRPLRSMYRFLRIQPLILPANVLIAEAAGAALKRSTEELYEPLVVQINQGYFRLLDTQQLLMAQLYVHQLSIELLKKTEAQLQETNLELEMLVNLDQLTQISNRRRFDDFLQVEWERHYRVRLPISLIMLDIDYFKYYNDYYGHQAGDDCLKNVAQIINQNVDQSNALVARYGGEEFAVVLPETDLETAEAIAEKIRLAIQDKQLPHIQSKVSPYVSISLGVSSQIPTYLTSIKTLIAAADAALYEAKQLGRNRVFSFYSELV